MTDPDELIAFGQVWLQPITAQRVLVEGVGQMALPNSAEWVESVTYRLLPDRADPMPTRSLKLFTVPLVVWRTCFMRERHVKLELSTPMESEK